MFGLFRTKKITIPIDNAQSVTELEFWTVEWLSYVNSFGMYAKEQHNAKVFILEEDRDEFIKQLRESAKFTNSTIHITTKKN